MKFRLAGNRQLKVKKGQDSGEAQAQMLLDLYNGKKSSPDAGSGDVIQPENRVSSGTVDIAGDDGKADADADEGRAVIKNRSLKAKGKQRPDNAKDDQRLSSETENEIGPKMKDLESGKKKEQNAGSQFKMASIKKVIEALVIN